MKKIAMLGAGILACGLGATPAWAQKAPDRPPGDIPGPIDSLSDLQDTARMVFKMADENNDGLISQKEATDAANLVVGGVFFRADQNGDGVLSKDEARQARDAFLNSRPWVRYVFETVRTAPEVKQAAANAKPDANANANTSPRSNLLATLASTFDSNNDQQLQASEVRQAVQTLVQGEFATADTNRDGQLSPTEVNAAAAGMSRQLADAAFQQADSDNNGQISQAEFEKAIVGPARVAFRIADLNNDGQISQEEAQKLRKVVASKVRTMRLPEPANSPRRQAQQALGSPTQPNQPAATPAPPAP